MLRQQLEFGDFQTPLDLANQVCLLLRRRRVVARTVVEPTCGQGHFLEAAAETFPDSRLLGFDCSSQHVRAARRRLKPFAHATSVQKADFFEFDWARQLDETPAPILVLGNPPWVNSARMTVVGGSNMPPKSNHDLVRGMDALTGRSNFDVSEWMLNRLTDALRGKQAVLAMLCKVSTARKVLRRAWRDRHEVSSSAMYRIDAQRHFGVSVDACLLFCRFGRGGAARCAVYADLQSESPETCFGIADGQLIADLDSYRAGLRFLHPGQRSWRSGIKHDCARVFELQCRDGKLLNGWNESVDLEAKCLFPLAKSSHLFQGRLPAERMLLITQRRLDDDTSRLEQEAGKTWRYLQRHAARLDRRRSSIYRNRCRFAMFGIGSYTFSPWKIAVSGLYKELKFVPLGRHCGKPYVLDDTCYFLPCSSKKQMMKRLRLLTDPAAQAFLKSFIFWDSKRPITAEILNRLDLDRLAGDLEGKGNTS